MQEKSLEVVHINKSFGQVKVLDDVSIKCRQGEIVGIVGRNGAGKTVLFKIMCGLALPDSGEVYVDGSRKKRAQDILRSVGAMIEEPAFLRNYSGIKNLEYLYNINHKCDKLYLESVMRKVGLEPASKKHVGKYSMGMRQRLAIAQAIMENPDYLILDEPFNGLDNQGVAQMREVFLNLKAEGKVMLLASHNEEDIRLLCDCVYHMESGRISRIQ